MWDLRELKILLVFCGGNNLKPHKNNAQSQALERAFSIMLAEILKLYGQAMLRIIINFQVIKKHKQ